MRRHIARRWVLAASVGCLIGGVTLPVAQAGPANAVARYMGVGWSEGRHARNLSPHSLHPSKPWSFPLSKLWNNSTAGPFAGNGPGHNEVLGSAPPLMRQEGPQHVAPHPLAPQPRSTNPPRTGAPAIPQREELRGGESERNEERSPSDEPADTQGNDDMDLPPPPRDELPYPVETRAHRSIMRRGATDR